MDYYHHHPTLLIRIKTTRPSSHLSSVERTGASVEHREQRARKSEKLVAPQGKVINVRRHQHRPLRFIVLCFRFPFVLLFFLVDQIHQLMNAIPYAVMATNPVNGIKTRMLSSIIKHQIFL
jgi:hypothetical protein